MDAFYTNREKKSYDLFLCSSTEDLISNSLSSEYSGILERVSFFEGLSEVLLLALYHLHKLKESKHQQVLPLPPWGGKYNSKKTNCLHCAVF